MARAQYKDLCLDACDVDRLGRFWASVLGLEFTTRDDGLGHIVGPTPQHTIWVNPVPEARTVKQRVHLDIYTRAIADLEALGGRVIRPQDDEIKWTVMADPEGGEFCAFLRDELPTERLHGLVVDCDRDPGELGRWWSRMYDADLDLHDGRWATVEHVPGMPILTFDLVPVPEPKAVKNRIHWDVTGDPAELAAEGAVVLREPDDEISWTVMADPHGNEFCVFPPL